MVVSHYNQYSRLPINLDEDGNWDGFSVESFYPKYSSTSDLMLALIPPPDEGGIPAFLKQFHLEDCLNEHQVRRLAIGEARLGKRLAEHLAVTIATQEDMHDVATWNIIKNVYERAKRSTALAEIDIDLQHSNELRAETLQHFSESLGAQLKLLRGYKLLTQEALGRRVDITSGQISDYELNKNRPDNAMLHKLADALEVDQGTRLLLFKTRFPEAFEQLNSADPVEQRTGKKALLGGGTLIGALLYHLREAKGISQSDVGQKIGVSSEQVSHYECGYDLPENITLHKFANALEVDSSLRRLLFEIRFPDETKGLSSADPESQRVARKAWLGGGTLVGAVLYRLRTDKGWSQDVLGEKVGISGTAVYRYEQGFGLPDRDILHKLADALETGESTRQLLDDTLTRKLKDIKHDVDKSHPAAEYTGVDDDVPLGVLLYRLRTEKGMSEKELGEKSGIGTAAVKRRERVYGFTENAVIHKWADALDVDGLTRTRMLERNAPDAYEKFKSSDATERRDARKAWLGGGTVLGSVLYHLRVREGLSQAELGDKIGVTRAQVSYYEQGNTVPDSEKMQKLMSVLHVPDCLPEGERGITQGSVNDIVARTRSDEARSWRQQIRGYNPLSSRGKK